MLAKQTKLTGVYDSYLLSVINFVLEFDAIYQTSHNIYIPLVEQLLADNNTHLGIFANPIVMLIDIECHLQTFVICLKDWICECFDCNCK